MLPRTTLGSKGSTHGSIKITPAAPTASAVRISVPRFPGVLRPVSEHHHQISAGQTQVVQAGREEGKGDDQALGRLTLGQGLHDIC